MTRKELLESIRARTGRKGVMTADRYFRSIEACFEGGFCPTKLFTGSSPDQWSKAIKEAENILTAGGGQIDSKSFKDAEEGSKGVATFDAIITTTKRDRDGDILMSKGAIPDPQMPLLFCHIPMQPIGSLVKILKQTDSLLKGRFLIADTDLGNDVLKLIEVGGLRISHGFEPVEGEYEPLDDEMGWLFKRFEIFETSVVSVPSNTAAVIEGFSRKKFRNEFVRQWAQKQFDARPAQVPGCEFKPSRVKSLDAAHACGCGGKSHKPATDAVPEQITEEQPLRWNRSLSKAFEVAHQDLQPASFILGWAKKFLETDIKEIYETNSFIPSARMGSFLTALEQEFAKHTLVDTRNIDYDGEERPPLYEQIQLNSKAAETFLIDGIRFFRSPNMRFMVKVYPDWGGLGLQIYCPLAGKDFANQLIGDCWAWAKTHNFLKGEAFSLSGEFLPRGEQGFDDIFLDDKNKVPLTRMVKQINEKQTACANRGIIAMGPPGTGKTLSGRAIKDQTNSTFIWISARDLEYSGAFGGFNYAFDLAEEVSPCVIFVEDIDNFMSDRTVDLLKSQMDGIGRSSGIVTILTTNFPERLPEALIDRPGRFHDVLKFDLPNEKLREQMLRKWLPALTPAELVKAVERTDGYSGAHLFELAAFAKTIQEQDEEELSAAVTKALDKITEQRELINQSQASASAYRPRREAAESLKKWRQNMLAKSPNDMAGPGEGAVVHPNGEPAAVDMMVCPKCMYRGMGEEFMPVDDEGEPSDPSELGQGNEGGMPKKSFGELRQLVVKEAFGADYEEVNRLVSQLRGVLEIAEAHRESRKRDEILELLGHN